MDKESFDIFRREALRSGRMSKEDLDISNAELLEKLDLMVDGKLKRAAALCFYREPEYLVHGGDIMVKFNALQSAKVIDSNASNEALDEALEMRLLNFLAEQPNMTQKELVIRLRTSRATLQRAMRKLEESKCIERKGGKRYGYWQVNK